MSGWVARDIILTVIRIREVQVKETHASREIFWQVDGVDVQSEHRWVVVDISHVEIHPDLSELSVTVLNCYCQNVELLHLKIQSTRQKEFPRMRVEEEESIPIIL